MRHFINRTVIVTAALICLTKAHADCRPGELSEVIDPVTVTRKDQSGQIKAIEVKVGTMAHVIEVAENSGKPLIKIYVGIDVDGNRISGLGEIEKNSTPKKLKCQ